MDRYEARGVSAKKTDVHAVVDRLDQGLFPGAFCKILPDYVTGSQEHCLLIHADGSGTKSILAYLYWKETGDISVFKGIAQDSVVMNTDDLACTGAVDQLVLASTINRNARNCPGEVLSALIEGTEEYLAFLRSQGIGIQSGGGETADVGDLTGTILVDSTLFCRMVRSKVIDASVGIRPGQVIIGFSSTGKAPWENTENSGIGSNGLTSARHELLGKYYRDSWPETLDPGMPDHLAYCGPFRLTDSLDNSPLTIGQALLSPTRSYAPLLAALYREHPGVVKAAIHCSGGGQTKCLRFGKAVHIVKDSLFPVPPLFSTIQKVSNTPWQEMYRVFNMGHRMEVYVAPTNAEVILQTAKHFGIEARLIGRVEEANQGAVNQLSLHTPTGEVLSYGL